MSEVAEAIPKKQYNLTPREKAEQLNVSISYLAKDRLRKEPHIPFRKYGNRVVRYSAED